MIQNIELIGFKSFVSEIIDLNRLTVLTGLNSSGKSSVIQAILMLQKVANKEINVLLEGHGDFDELKNPFEKNAVSLKADCERGKISIEKNIPIYPSESSIYPKIIYVSANRFGPEVSLPIRTYDNNMGERGENILRVIEINEDNELNPILRHEKSQGDTFKFNLEAWLDVISPGVSFKYEIQKQSDSSYSLFNDHRATNVGYGLSYVLPVITALLLGSITPNSLVIIENPEAHLHPKGQTEMARLIALCVQVGVQVIIETHSDHLFNGIRIFTKRNPDFASLVNLYWFELDKNNNTSVEPTELESDGRVKYWPTGMFDQFEINASELL